MSLGRLQNYVVAVNSDVRQPLTSGGDRVWLSGGVPGARADAVARLARLPLEAGTAPGRQR